MNEYKIRKEKKYGMQKEIAKAGFAVEYADNATEATVMNIKDYDEREKKIVKVIKLLDDEERRA